MPVFAQAREKARQASCTGNLKQIMTGLMMYTQDYDEKIPQMWHYGVDVQRPRIETLPVPIYWHALMQPYIKNYQVFVCPSCGKDFGRPRYSATYPVGTSCNVHDPNDAVQRSTAWDNYHIGSGSYGINTCYARDCTSGPCQGVSIANVARPAEKILVAEFDKNWHPAGLYLPKNAERLVPGGTPGCGVWGFGFLWGPTDRHTAGRNAGYWDGHVKLVRAAPIDRENPSPSIRQYAPADPGGDSLTQDPRPLIVYGQGSE